MNAQESRNFQALSCSRVGSNYNMFFSIQLDKFAAWVQFIGSFHMTQFLNAPELFREKESS